MTLTLKTTALLAACVSALALSACQPGGSDADVKELRQDVDALKLEVFGDPFATCPADKVLEDISAYASTLEGMPAANDDPEAWHLANGARKDVITTKSGLQYTVVQKGLDKASSPSGSQPVTLNYHGFFPDGTKFDSSYDRNDPIVHTANGFIKGWNEALEGMKPCEARTLYIPGDLAYGSKGRPSIPPNATLVFHMQLLSYDPKG